MYYKDFTTNCQSIINMCNLETLKFKNNLIKIHSEINVLFIFFIEWLICS